jgi:hypothetical protein
MTIQSGPDHEENDRKLQLTELSDCSHNALEDVDIVSLEPNSKQYNNYWSPFSKKNHRHNDDDDDDDDDEFTSASTVYHHKKNQFTAIKKLFFHVMGDIYADDNPREYSKLRKNTIIMVVALSGISGPIGSMIYMPGLTQIQGSLNASTAAINGSVSAYVIFTGIAVCNIYIYIYIYIFIKPNR